MSKETGGPAFPIAQINATVTTDGMGRVHQTAFVPAREGMTLRDYFAGQAMAALFDSDAGHDAMECQIIATEAYEMADAMLKERER